jgi:hypothetical protein
MSNFLSLDFSTNANRISVADRATRSIKFENVGGSVVFDGRSIALSECRSSDRRVETDAAGATVEVISFQFEKPDFRWAWKVSKNAQELEITATLENTGDRPLELDTWNVLHADSSSGSSVRLGADASNVRFFGWRPWDMRVETLACNDGHHNSHNLCHLYDPESEITFSCAFVTLDRMMCRHEIMYSADSGVDEYRAICEVGNYALQPGSAIVSETLRIGFYSDPYRALETWAETVHGMYRPDFADRPPVGWIGGWADAWSDREDCWETFALDNAKVINEKLKGLGVHYIWTSQTNLKDGIPGNWLNVEEKQIPSGLKGFFENLERLGFTPGLWMAPFWFFDEAPGVLEENRNNLLKDSSGEPIREMCDWEFDVNADPEGALRLTKYYLDGSHPGTFEFVKKIFSYYREIGVRYYMLDFLSIKESAILFDPSLTHMEAARSILETIHETAGDDTHLQTAVSSTPGFIGLIDAARVGRDFGEGRPLFPPVNTWRNAVCVLHDHHFGNTKYLLQNAAASYFTHRKIYINDYNMLTIDKPMPLNHAKIAVTVFGVGGGSPLMLGDDYRRIDPERLRMVKLCLPRTQDVPVPVDLFDDVYPDGYCRMLKLSVDAEWDSYLLVAVFSLDDDANDTDVEFTRLGLEADASYRVWEFWSEEYLGTFAGRFRSVVSPGSCRLYRISRAREYPWLLSTDLHIQQGAVEIASLVWNENTMTLSGVALRPAGERGSLFFLMPRKYRMINYEDAHLLKDVRDMNVIVRREIPFTSDREEFELRFEPVGTRYVSRRGWLPYATEEEWLAYIADHRSEDDTRIVD